MKSIAISLLISILILGPAWGNQPLRKLPHGSSVKVGENVLRAYTLEEFKIVLRIYADYKGWHRRVPLLSKEVVKLTAITNNQKDQIKLLKDDAKVLQGERKRLTKKWEEENRLRHLCENKPAFGSWIAWGSAGAMGLVATVLAVILIAKD